jgi:hypothetical protein
VSEPEEIVVECGNGKTTVVKRLLPKSESKDPVMSATTLEQLQRLVDDYEAHPELAMRASQRITELVAARITGADREMPFLNRVRVNGETVLLDSFDRETLERMYTTSLQAIRSCQDHDRKLGIKCQCLSDFRDWYYRLQNCNPTDPSALAAGNLWERLDEDSRSYERPKQADPTLTAMLEILDSYNGLKEDGTPGWLGTRSKRGEQRQLERKRKK